jgi:hypothetical protein
LTDPRERLLVLLRDRPPLGVALAALRVLSFAVPRGVWSAIGERTLGLRGRSLARFSRHAWWGRDAAHAVRVRLDDPSRAGTVRSRVTAEADVVEALARTPLLIGAHVGPGQAAPDFLRRVRPDVLGLFWHAHPGIGGRQVVLADPDARRLSLGTLAAELRAGGQVFAAADGSWGGERLTLPFLGGSVALNPALARAALRTRVEARPLVALWEGSRIRIRLGAPLASPDGSENAWLRSYLAFLEETLRNRPESLRLDTGGWWGTYQLPEAPPPPKLPPPPE